MTNIVVDASIGVKWFFTEEFTENSLNLFNESYILHAPDFFQIEIDNVICKRIRRKKISKKEGDSVRNALVQIPITYHNYLSLRDPAFDLSNKTGSSMYDCFYLALALWLENPMVTADRRLFNNLTNTKISKYVIWIEDIM